MDEKTTRNCLQTWIRTKNAAADFRSVCEQPIDIPHYGLRLVLIPDHLEEIIENREPLWRPSLTG